MRLAPILLAVGLVASSAGTSIATTAPEPAARGGGVFINSVLYDPAGTDTGTNRHINREIVRITNNANQRRSLRGWTLRDTAGHVYRFPRTTLRPGRTVAVHTGKGRDQGLQRYWDQGNYIWNNDGDTAKLRNRSGNLIDTCRWRDGSGFRNC